MIDELIMIITNNQKNAARPGDPVVTWAQPLYSTVDELIDDDFGSRFPSSGCS
jgi:hypothetical protein